MVQIDQILAGMNLKEKIAFCTGADFWHTKALPEYHVPQMMMSDGPHGLRCQKGKNDMIGIRQSQPATCFPAAVTAGASWNEELYAEEGEAIGKEALAAGVSVVLGPGCNIKRNPLGGRNFEYLSEDPYLAGKMAAAYIRGQQAAGVSSSLKHFAVNSQEYKRMNGDSQVDERTLREIYLTPFEIAVKEGKPDTVMCAYNKVNGVHCSDSRWLLTEILREEWGFDGMVVTDWGALNDRVAGFHAGCDLNMPGGSRFMEKDTLKAVQDGILEETDIDRAVERILRIVCKAEKRLESGEEPANRNGNSSDKKKEPGFSKKKESDFCGEDSAAGMGNQNFVENAGFENHHKLALKIAEQGAVLLKNEDHILPLRTDDIVLIGYMAGHMRYQGGGSSHVNPIRQINLTEVMPGTEYVPCCDREGNVTEEALQKAAEAAAGHRFAVVVAGLPEACESEALDREHMRLPEGHNRMVERVAKANPDTVVILLGGGPMELPWEKDVKGILYMGLPGQAAGEAAYHLLAGQAVPSGKLTETWPVTYEDVVSKETFGKKNVEYREGVYVGYRYYDSAGKAVRYPFGHGLSYTSFEYTALEICWPEVSVTVKNTGACKGAEVVQLYINPEKGNFWQEDGQPDSRISDLSCKESRESCSDGSRQIPADLKKSAGGISCKNELFRPEKELKGFVRLELEPGECKKAEFLLDDRCFAVWQKGWKVPKGNYIIMAASSSRDIRLQKMISVEGVRVPVPEWQKGSWYETLSGLPGREEWELLMGHPVPPEPEPGRGTFTLDNTCLEMKDHALLMKIICKIMEFFIARLSGGKNSSPGLSYRMLLASAADCPLRALVIHSGGLLGDGIVRLLLRIVNVSTSCEQEE